MSRVITRAATPQKNTVKSGKIIVRSSKYGIELEDRQEIEVDTFPEGVAPAYVHVGVGRTINLGDYNSLKLDISVTMPCYPEEIEAVQVAVSNKVADMLAEESKAYGVGG